MDNQWAIFRRNDIAFLKEKLNDLLPEDHIIEYPKKVNCYYSGGDYESASTVAVLTKKGYQP